MRQRLLDTPPERVPHEFAHAIIDFCRQVDAVTAAYVGLTEVSEGFGYPQEQLAAAFELASAGDDELRVVADSFYELLPENVQAGGCNVLAGDGVAVWREKAQQVFRR